MRSTPSLCERLDVLADPCEQQQLGHRRGGLGDLEAEQAKVHLEDMTTIDRVDALLVSRVNTVLIRSHHTRARTNLIVVQLLTEARQSALTNSLQLYGILLVRRVRQHDPAVTRVANVCEHQPAAAAAAAATPQSMGRTNDAPVVLLLVHGLESVVDGTLVDERQLREHAVTSSSVRAAHLLALVLRLSDRDRVLVGAGDARELGRDVARVEVLEVRRLHLGSDRDRALQQHGR